MSISTGSGKKPTTGQLSPDWIELLFEVTEQFASTLEIDEVLGRVLTRAMHAVRALNGGIYLLHPSGLVFRSITTTVDTPPNIQFHRPAIGLEPGLASWAYINRQAVITADAQDDDRWRGLAEFASMGRSVIAVPLLRHEVVVAVMVAGHPDPEKFSKRQLQLLDAIGRQAAFAIENAKLYSRVNADRSSLQAIISRVQDAIVVTDFNGAMVLANSAANRALELNEAMLGKPLSAIITDAALNHFYQTATLDGATREVALGDGRVFDCSMVVVPNVGRMLVMHNITHRIKLDHIKTEFVSQVAHDLKAPLSVIHGYIWLLEELPNLSGESKEYVAAIIEATERMSGLIESILELGHIEMGIKSEMRVIDLVKTVRGAVAGQKPLASEKGIDLTLNEKTPLPQAFAAPNRLGMAVTQLVNNAVKFTPAGGAVEVTLQADDEQISISVSDTGPGIPAAMQDRLFEKFSRVGQKATKDAEGHGLGLAIVKSVADAHGGRVWVESKVGKGSLFALCIPLQPGGASTLPAK